MTMNKVASIIFTATILFGCAKAVTEGNNESEKLFLDAWAHLNLTGITPEWNGESDEYGIYVINEKDGDGAVVEKDGYAVSGKSIMALMTLEAVNGTVLKVTADGPQAKEVLDDLEGLVSRKFDIPDEQ